MKILTFLFSIHFGFCAISFAQQSCNSNIDSVNVSFFNLHPKQQFIAINVNSSYLKPQDAKIYVKRIAHDNGLIVAATWTDSIRMTFGGPIADACGLHNLFWLQKSQLSNWNEQDSIVISKLQSDTLFDAIGIPISTNHGILTNSLILCFFDWVTEEEGKEVIRDYKLKNQSHNFLEKSKLISVDLPIGIIATNNLVNELMNRREIKFVYPVIYNFRCDE